MEDALTRSVSSPNSEYCIDALRSAGKKRNTPGVKHKSSVSCTEESGRGKPRAHL